MFAAELSIKPSHLRPRPNRHLLPIAGGDARKASLVAGRKVSIVACVKGRAVVEQGVRHYFAAPSIAGGGGNAKGKGRLSFISAWDFKSLQRRMIVVRWSGGLFRRVDFEGEDKIIWNSRTQEKRPKLVSRASIIQGRRHLSIAIHVTCACPQNDSGPFS